MGQAGQTSPVGQAAAAGGLAGEAASGPGGPPEPATQADTDTQVSAAGRLGQPEPGAPGIVAFRPRSEPALPAADDEKAAQQADARARAGRVLRGASLSRLKRPGAPADRSPAASEGQGQGTGQPEDDRDWNAASASADAATWAASELPGQAAVTDTAV